MLLFWSVFGSRKAESSVNKTDPTSHEGRGTPKAPDAMGTVRDRKGRSGVEGGERNRVKLLGRTAPTRAGLPEYGGVRLNPH